jgi:hypothetical protein
MKVEDEVSLLLITVFLILLLSLIWGGDTSFGAKVRLSLYLILTVPLFFITWATIHAIWRRTASALASCVLGFVVFMAFVLSYEVIMIRRIDAVVTGVASVIGGFTLASELWTRTVWG